MSHSLCENIFEKIHDYWTLVIQNEALWERTGRKITRLCVSKVLLSTADLWDSSLGINSREGAEKGLLVPGSSVNPSVLPQTNGINVSRNQSP